MNPRRLATVSLLFSGLLGWFSLSLPACSSGSSPNDNDVIGDPDQEVDTPVEQAEVDETVDLPTETDGEGDSAVVVGAFQVILYPPVTSKTEQAGYTWVNGQVNDGPTPAQTLWDVAATEGDCKLLTPRVPFCGDLCTISQACVGDNRCQDYPNPSSAGIIHVTGIHDANGGNGFDMEPIAGNYQPPTGLTLPYPAFTEGEDITLTAPGDATAGFTLTGKGIQPLELLNGDIELTDEQPLVLTWTAPGQADLATIYVKIDVSHHGGTKGLIECETQDTGRLELSGSFVGELLDLGVAGYPSILVMRKTTGSTTVASGRLELVVSSSVTRQVSIPGVISCNDSTDCPEGMTCNDFNRTCVNTTR